MSFPLWINHKRYIVGDHAARRMLERGISDDTIIRTMEEGSVQEQQHKNDLYEHTFYDECLRDTITIRIIVNERLRFIMTVIDLTDDEEE